MKTVKKASDVKIAPSILSANFAHLEQDIRKCEMGGADWLHLDIMDGRFVPNISFGPMVVRTIRSLTELPLDTHLMVIEPERYLEDFQKAGATRLTIHIESTTHLHRTITRIKELGMNAGVTLNPATPLESIREIIPYVDLVLIMTVNPGFGGQKFISSMVDKIQRASELISDINPNAFLQVDGGVDESNASIITRAGANVLVAGNSVFSKRNIPKAIQNLRSSAVKK